MVMRPRLRPLPSLFLGLALAGLAGLPHRAAAAPLDEEACNRLRTERQSLTVLGVDKNFDKGAEWAKTNLNAADLTLVKRYLDVFEQIKFRCEKVAALVEPEEKDEEDEEGEAGAPGSVPMPERNGGRPVKASPPAVKASLPLKTAAPTAPTAPEVEEEEEVEAAKAESEAAKTVNSTDIVKSPGKRSTNSNAVQLGPRRDLPR